MRKFDKGIRFYTDATLNLFFPEDDVCCGQCILCYKDNLDRPRCSYMGALVYSLDTICDFCPLTFKQSGEEKC